jgi:starvation-inducible DNA-binding protein
VTETNEAFGMEPLPAGPVADRDVGELLSARLNEVIVRLRARAKSLGEADLASQAIVVDVLLVLEKHEWMLRSQNPR